MSGSEHSLPSEHHFDPVLHARDGRTSVPSTGDGAHTRASGAIPKVETVKPVDGAEAAPGARRVHAAADREERAAAEQQRRASYVALARDSFDGEAQRVGQSLVPNIVTAHLNSRPGNLRMHVQVDMNRPVEANASRVTDSLREIYGKHVPSATVLMSLSVRDADGREHDLVGDAVKAGLVTERKNVTPDHLFIVAGQRIAQGEAWALKGPKPVVAHLAGLLVGAGATAEGFSTGNPDQGWRLTPERAQQDASDRLLAVAGERIALQQTGGGYTAMHAARTMQREFKDLAQLAGMQMTLSPRSEAIMQLRAGADPFFLQSKDKDLFVLMTAGERGSVLEGHAAAPVPAAAAPTPRPAAPATPTPPSAEPDAGRPSGAVAPADPSPPAGETLGLLSNMDTEYWAALAGIGTPAPSGSVPAAGSGKVVPPAPSGTVRPPEAASPPTIAAPKPTDWDNAPTERIPSLAEPLTISAGIRATGTDVSGLSAMGGSTVRASGRIT